MRTFRDTSRKDWKSDDTIEHINAGSLQRIAAATEEMAKSFLALQGELSGYKQWYEEERDSRRRLTRTVTALRGVITRMKRKSNANSNPAAR